MRTLITAGALLAHDKVDKYRPFGAFGKPAYQSHVQLRAMLLSRLGIEYANYFARPVYDPDTGELRWIAECAGTEKKAEDLDDAARQRVQDKTASIHTALGEMIAKLRAEGGNSTSGAGAYASLLEQALKVPQDGRHLHYVDEQPVLSFWGFETQQGGSLDPAAVASRYPATVPPAGPGMISALPVEEQHRRPWWWWLLWLLMLLLLLLLLLVGMRACRGEAMLDLKGAIPGLAEPSSPGALGASDPSAPIGPGMTGRDGVGGGSAVPGGPGTGPDGSMPGAMPHEGAASSPADAKPEDSNALKDPEADKDKDKDPNKDPSKDPDKDKNKKKDDKPTPDQKGKIDPPKPPEDPRALEMPDDPKAAEKMGFLEGKWKAGDGLIDNKTQQPLDMSFDFNKDGKGEISMRRKDGSTCKGEVQGNMKGSKLSIDGAQSIPCSGGGSYAPPKIECNKDKSGQTQCFGINPDGSRYYMGVQRQP